MEYADQRQKLVVDFRPAQVLRDGMDEDTRKLIDWLCTQVGSAMEDVSVIALTTRPLPDDQLLATLEQIEAEVDRMAAWIRDARSLAE